MGQVVGPLRGPRKIVGLVTSTALENADLLLRLDETTGCDGAAEARPHHDGVEERTGDFGRDVGVGHAGHGSDLMASETR